MKQSGKKLQSNIGTLYQMASDHFNRGELKDAETLTRSVLAKNENHPDATHLLGMIAIKCKQYQPAIQLIKRAIQLKPQQISYLNSLGLAMHKEGNLNDALEVCEKILKQKPRMLDALDNQSLILIELDRLEEALATCNKAIKVKPQHAQAHYNRALALKKMERFDEALSSSERATRLNPKFIKAHNLSAVILKDLGRSMDSLNSCNLAIKLDSQYVEAYNNKSVALLDLNKEEEALISANQAVQIDPESAIAQFNLGLILKAMGRSTEALEPCKRAAMMNPDYAPAHYTLGLVLKDHMQYEEALSACERAVELEPLSFDCWLNLSSIYIDMGRRVEASHACKKAIEINPMSAHAHTNLAFISLFDNQDEARASLQSALELEPDLVRAKYLLAALGDEEAPDQSPNEYVITLFDDYANTFDQHLVNNLNYQVPQQLLQVVEEQLNDVNQKLDIIDLGCGTGLCGVEFANHAKRLVGVDLSPRMLSKTRERGLYTNLIEADVCTAMSEVTQPFDLILSADVFIYIGKLEEIFALASKKLNLGGLFAFSIEDNETQQDYRLTISGRYAQSLEYIQRLTDENGFEQLARLPVTLRQERGIPAIGSIFVLRLKENKLS